VRGRPALALLAATALLGSGCASDPRARLRQAEQRHRELSASLLAAEQAVEPVSAYVAELSSPQSARGSFSMYYSASALEQMAAQMVPYKMTGKDFHKQLTGDIIAERLSDIRFSSRNRLMARLHLKAQGVRYTGSVPPGYGGRVKALEKAIASGGYADLEVQLTLQGSRVIAQVKARDLQLRVKSQDSGEVLTQMNKRAFNRPFVFDMSIPGGGQVPRRLLVTGNHVVVTYQ
jgi:hypothetical protein